MHVFLWIICFLFFFFDVVANVELNKTSVYLYRVPGLLHELVSIAALVYLLLFCCYFSLDLRPVPVPLRWGSLIFFFSIYIRMGKKTEAPKKSSLSYGKKKGRKISKNKRKDTCGPVGIWLHGVGDSLLLTRDSAMYTPPPLSKSVQRKEKKKIRVGTKLAQRYPRFFFFFGGGRGICISFYFESLLHYLFTSMSIEVYLDLDLYSNRYWATYKCLYVYSGSKVLSRWKS